MKTGFVVSIQRHLYALLIAAALAFAAFVSAMLMEQIRICQPALAVSACSASGGGC